VHKASWAAQASIGVALAVSMVAMSGCSPAADRTPAVAPAPAVEPTAPHSIEAVSVTAELYRTRSDPARGGIQLSVTNHGDVAVTIVGLLLDSPALATPIRRDRSTTIPAGSTRDLALTLPAPACTGGATMPEAALTVILDTNETAVVRVTTTDRLGQWAVWHAEACFAAAVADRVTLEVRRAPALDDLSAGVIGLEIVATARASGVTLVALDDTVLFTVDAATGPPARLTMLALDLTLSKGEERVVPVRLAAARCDPHAIAEDKQGTLFSLELALGPNRGIATIAADDATRSQLYDALSALCGF
jgi:hypothetical protein